MKTVVENGYAKYIKSRPAASSDSCKRIKEMSFNTLAVHSMFKGSNKDSNEKEVMLTQMKSYRPQGVSNAKTKICSMLSL